MTAHEWIIRWAEELFILYDLVQPNLTIAETSRSFKTANAKGSHHTRLWALFAIIYTCTYILDAHLLKTGIVVVKIST